MSNASDNLNAQRNAAVALKYDGNRAPTVAATGRDELAQEIIRLAQEHEIPLYENAELAGILARLDLDEEIPETLYRIIAEILSFAFHLQGKMPGDAEGSSSPFFKGGDL